MEEKVRVKNMDHFKIGNDKFPFEPLLTNFDLLEFSKYVEENDTVLDSLRHLQVQRHKNCGMTNDTEGKRKHDDIKLEILKGMLKSYDMEANAMREERNNALNLLECHTLEVDVMREERDNALKTVEELRTKQTEERQPLPSFTCPITQEIMEDPHVTADGFTYEAEAIRTWLINKGRDRSPMTNDKLSHKNLVPNRALKSAIEEYLNQS